MRNKLLQALCHFTFSNIRQLQKKQSGVGLLCTILDFEKWAWQYWQDLSISTLALTTPLSSSLVS
jgi:hypothetical protein